MSLDFFFFKQKTAYEMRISDWSSDVCSSDLLSLHPARQRGKPSSRNPARIGLAIAGGGPIGGMYELGALRALDEALDGLDLTDLDSYVGVSSGEIGRAHV